MSEFTDSNTEGFSAAQLAVMNDAYRQRIASVLADLPEGSGDNADMMAQVSQGVSEAVLKQFGEA